MKTTLSAATLLSDLEGALPACAQCEIRDGVLMGRGMLSTPRDRCYLVAWVFREPLGAPRCL